jgi:hypothetical protein
MASLYDYGLPQLNQNMMSLYSTMQQEKRLKAEENQQNIINQKNMFELNRAMEQEARLSKPVNASGWLLAQGTHPEDAKVIEGMWESSGLGKRGALGNIIMEARNMPQAIQFIQDNPKNKLAIAQSSFDRLKNEYATIVEEEQNILAKGSDGLQENKKYQEILRKKAVIEKQANIRAEQIRALQKPDTSLTEAEILSLPEGDQRRASYIKGKEQINVQKPYAASIQDEAYRLVKEQFVKDGVQREPYASEVSEMVTALTNTRKTAEYQAMKTVKDEGGFASWKPEAKHQTFMFNAITGEPPVNVKGLAGTDRQAYGKEFAQWVVDQGLTAQDIAVMRADFKSGSMTLNNMKKQEAPMKAFVDNINQQVDYASKLFKDLQRTDARLINVPLRELRTRVKGSGLEQTYELFMQEISAESYKLASGSSASIAQIPEGARKDWVRIHDVNLPLKEILQVLEGTKKMANLRLSSWQDAKRGVRDELKAIGTLEENNTPNKPTGTSKFKILKVE